jgi:hypothetical protein
MRYSWSKVAGLSNGTTTFCALSNLVGVIRSVNSLIEFGQVFKTVICQRTAWSKVFLGYLMRSQKKGFSFLILPDSNQN